MIGLLGGTFDPIHYGHLRVALEVKELFSLTEVRLIPSATPPHRLQPAASAQMRSEMLALAVKNHPALRVDTRELGRSGASYTVDTLASLRKDFPDESLLLFIGADAFLHLTHWYRWQHLFDYAHVVVMTRPGFMIEVVDCFFSERLVHAREALVQTRAGKLFFQAVTPLDISATAIRRMIAEKQNPGFLLPDAVIEYIQQNQLYQARSISSTHDV
ncbi:MAG: nicotinate-nucleotide adenylyltransferase [Methylovulum sp.]|nr:nicotinate-nucleotide adenylyltransferase [Methylovulum sp.]MCF7998875.1 nicotinate-nucleotide adenylyltransferase [Methylovulum sp.]